MAVQGKDGDSCQAGGSAHGLQRLLDADPHDPGTLDVVGFYATVLNLVTPVVPKKPTYEILKSVLLTFHQAGTLDIRATDTENEITGWVPCETIGDSFSIAVDAKPSSSVFTNCAAPRSRYAYRKPKPQCPCIRLRQARIRM